MGQADALLRRLDLKGEVEHDNTDQTLLPPHRFTNLRALSGMTLHSLGDQFVAEIRNSTNDYNQKVITALQEVSNSREDKAKDMAIWKQQDRIITRNGLVVVPRNREIRQKIIEACHDTPIAGHPGQLKARELVQHNYWWPGMIWDINRYVDGCQICPKVKPIREKPVGQLKPTEIAKEPWEIISVDFIVELPESNGYNCIMNVVDRHSKLLYSGA
jgi:hypothetical protein